MKNLHILLLSIICSFFLLSSCSNSKSHRNFSANNCFILTEDTVESRFLSWDPTWDNSAADRTYILPYDGRIVPFDSESTFEERIKVKTEIILDSNVDSSLDPSTFEFVDTILKKLYLGIELVGMTDVKRVDLQNVETKELLNSGNILNSIKASDDNAFDEDKELHIYLFKHSDFFNTSNAFAFSSGKHKIILGNKDLFNSSLLFVHELGHSFGLGHNNRQDTCSDHSQRDSFFFFNIMHESNIGCAICLDPQQALLVGYSEDYISFNQKTANVLPVNGPENCDCNTKYYKTKMDKYINSKDRSIDDAALIGMHSAITPELFEEAETGEIPEVIANTYRANFEKSSAAFFDDSSTRDLFVNQSMAGLSSLRQKNLIRLIGHNLIESTMQFEEDFNWEDLFTDPDTLSAYITQYKEEAEMERFVSMTFCKENILAKEIARLESRLDSRVDCEYMINLFIKSPLVANDEALKNDIINYFNEACQD